MSGTVLVDANVLLDILTADERWLAWSTAELRSAKASGSIAVNAIICAEIAPAFDFEWTRVDEWLMAAGILKCASLPQAIRTTAHGGGHFEGSAAL